MAGGLVLPTDNAVIDYSIISQIIAALNQQQSQINTLNTSLGLSSTNTGTISSTGTASSTTGIMVSVGGSQAPDGGAATGTSFTVKFPIGGKINHLSSITGVAYTGASTAVSCWLYSIQGGTQVVFKTSAPAKYIYWTAVGTA